MRETDICMSAPLGRHRFPDPTSNIGVLSIWVKQSLFCLSLDKLMKLVKKIVTYCSSSLVMRKNVLFNSLEKCFSVIDAFRTEKRHFSKLVAQRKT